MKTFEGAGRGWSWSGDAMRIAGIGGVAAALAGLVGFGCTGSDPVGSCQVGADCASGICSQGMCVNNTGSGGDGAGGDGAASSGGAGGAGEGGAGAGGAGGTAGAGACAPNFDGSIERSEIPIGPGLSAKFLTATEVSFNTAPDVQGGVNTWDLSGDFDGDHVSLANTEAITGKWYADTFPSGDYAARLSDTEDLLGVFELTDDELLLLGVVSPDDGFSATELVYDPPVKVLKFPLEIGSSWTTSTSVSGLAQGVFALYDEVYQHEVDEEGTLFTPFGEFPVLRLGFTLERTIGLLTTTTRTYSFTSECFGTVATVTSEDDPPGDEFVDVAELKRLTP